MKYLNWSTKYSNLWKHIFYSWSNFIKCSAYFTYLCWKYIFVVLFFEILLYKILHGFILCKLLHYFTVFVQQLKVKKEMIPLSNTHDCVQELDLQKEPKYLLLLFTPVNKMTWKCVQINKCVIKNVQYEVQTFIHNYILLFCSQFYPN